MARWLLLVLFGVGILAGTGTPVIGADAPGGDAVKAEMKKLRGTWKVEAAVVNGKIVDADRIREAVIEGDKLTFRPANGKEERVTIAIDPTQNPKAIDFDPDEKAPDVVPNKAVYELNGDTLKICIGDHEKRPGKITEAGRAVLILKRVNVSASR